LRSGVPGGQVRGVIAAESGRRGDGQDGQSLSGREVTVMTAGVIRAVSYAQQADQARSVEMVTGPPENGCQVRGELPPCRPVLRAVIA
jgi:hypothetical protein